MASLTDPQMSAEDMDAMLASGMAENELRAEFGDALYERAEHLRRGIATLLLDRCADSKRGARIKNFPILNSQRKFAK